MLVQVFVVILELERITKEASINVNDITTDLFGEVLVKEAVLWTVQQPSRVDEYLDAMMCTVLSVLKRQYKSYISLSDSEKAMLYRDTGTVYYIYIYIYIYTCIQCFHLYVKHPYKMVHMSLGK